jgi:hypothetical protein
VRVIGLNTQALYLFSHTVSRILCLAR